MNKPTAERAVPRAHRAAPRRSTAAPSRGSSRVPFTVLIGGLIAAGMVTLLGLNTAAAANEVQRSSLVEQDQNVGARLVGLRNQAAASAAPANLARAAAALGMVPAGQPGFLEVARDGRVRLLGRAFRATGVPVVAPTATAPPRPSAPATPRSTPTRSATATPGVARTGRVTATATATVTVTATASVSSVPREPTSRHHHRAREAAPSLNPATATTPSPPPSPTPQLTLPGGTR